MCVVDGPRWEGMKKFNVNELYKVAGQRNSGKDAEGETKDKGARAKDAEEPKNKGDEAKDGEGSGKAEEVGAKPAAG